MTSQVLTAETVKSCSPGTSVHFNQTKRRHVSEVSLPVYKLSPYSTDTNIVSDDSSVLISRVTGIGEKQGIVGRVAGRWVTLPSKQARSNPVMEVSLVYHSGNKITSVGSLYPVYRHAFP